jgi:hypothetical protein
VRCHYYLDDVALQLHAVEEEADEEDDEDHGVEDDGGLVEAVAFERALLLPPIDLGNHGYGDSHL